MVVEMSEKGPEFHEEMQTDAEKTEDSKTVSRRVAEDRRDAEKTGISEFHAESQRVLPSIGPPTGIPGFPGNAVIRNSFGNPLLCVSAPLCVSA